LHAGWRTWLFATRAWWRRRTGGPLLGAQPEPAVSLKRRVAPARSPRPHPLRAGAPLPYVQYRSYPTEFMGLHDREIHGNAVIVRRIAPADVEPGTPPHPRRAGTDL